jgi:hypothetical protein
MRVLIVFVVIIHTFFLPLEDVGPCRMADVTLECHHKICFLLGAVSSCKLMDSERRKFKFVLNDLITDEQIMQLYTEKSR